MRWTTKQKQKAVEALRGQGIGEQQGCRRQGGYRPSPSAPPGHCRTEQLRAAVPRWADAERGLCPRMVLAAILPGLAGFAAVYSAKQVHARLVRSRADTGAPAFGWTAAGDVALLCCSMPALRLSESDDAKIQYLSHGRCCRAAACASAETVASARRNAVSCEQRAVRTLVVALFLCGT